MLNKKIFSIMLVTGVALFGAYSCKKQERATPPSVAEFAIQSSASANGSYYVQDDANSVFKIPVGFTTVANKDRVINISYSSPTGAASGVQYNAPASVTIPAGQAIDTLRINGLFGGFPTGRVDTLVVKIDGGDAPANAYNNTYKVVLRKYCNVVLDELKGDYANSSDLQVGYPPAIGPYTAKITDITSTGPTTATAIIYNFGAPMFGDYGTYGDPPFAGTDLAINPGITVNLDWSDPANFKVTVPTQVIAESIYGTGGVIKAASTGAGTFSSCENTFTIKYSFAIGSTSYGNFTTTLKR